MDINCENFLKFQNNMSNLDNLEDRTLVETFNFWLLCLHFLSGEGETASMFRALMRGYQEKSLTEINKRNLSSLL